MPRPYNPLNGGQNADNFGPGGYYNPTGDFGVPGAPPGYGGYGSGWYPKVPTPVTPAPAMPGMGGGWWSGLPATPISPSQIPPKAGPYVPPPTPTPVVNNIPIDQMQNGGPYIPSPPVSYPPSSVQPYLPPRFNPGSNFGRSMGMRSNRQFASPFTGWANGVLRQLSSTPRQLPTQQPRPTWGRANTPWG